MWEMVLLGTLSLDLALGVVLGVRLRDNPPTTVTGVNTHGGSTFKMAELKLDPTLVEMYNRV